MLTGPRLRPPGMVAASMLALWSSSASALPTARLEYSRGPGAEDCVDAHAVAQAVAARLGYDPFDPGAPDAMRAHIERGAGRFAAVLALVDRAGNVLAERRLESTGDCAELVSAVALSMSIVIDPERAAEVTPASTPEPQPPPAQTPAQPAVTKPKAPAAVVRRRKRSPQPLSPQSRAQDERSAAPADPVRAPDDPRHHPPLFLRLTAGAHLAFGLEPGTAPGASISAGARLGRWSLSLGGRYDAAAHRDVSPRGTIEADLLGATLTPCVHHGLFLACAVGLVGSMQAKSSGITESDSDSELFAALGARLGIERSIADGLAWQASADLLAALRPLSVRLSGRSVWDMPRASAALATGLAMEF
jgi:hypothetical protein